MILGINIDGEHLTHLRFADNIVRISNNEEHLQEMLNDLNRESLKVGLQMHRGKTRVLFNDKAQRRVIRVCLKRKVYNQCVLPTISY